jgi:hypothetical protein
MTSALLRKADPVRRGEAATGRPDLDIHMLAAIAWSRGELYASGDLEFHDAVDGAAAFAACLGIDADAAQAIIAPYFAAARNGLSKSLDDPPIIALAEDEAPPIAASTLDAAAWLYRHSRDADAWAAFLNRHSYDDVAAILRHLDIEEA